MSGDANEEAVRESSDDHDLPPRAEDAVRAKRTSFGSELESTPPTIKAEVTVDNQSALQAVAHIPRHISGTVDYEPGKLIIRKYSPYLNSIVQVRVAHRWLTRTNALVSQRALWGSGVYTEDSDLVAALYHEGHIGSDESEHPQGDLFVSLIILPRLRGYKGSYMNGVFSRTWHAPHDGVSFMISGVRKLPENWTDGFLPRGPQAEIDWAAIGSLA